jgi:hypothetical protein
MQYTITNDPVETFNTNFIRSFGPGVEDFSLEMVDVRGERYKKFYKAYEAFFHDYNTLVKNFEAGYY